MLSKTEEKCAEVARKILTSTATNKFSVSAITAAGLVYRKGMALVDIKKALEKAKKADKRGKYEVLEGWLALYLKQVLKPIPKSKEEYPRG